MPQPIELAPLADRIWTVNAPCSVLGMPIGHRMTVVKLSNGGLWLHSPVEYSDLLVGTLAPVGPIAHWVAPSRTHDLYLDGWFANCPEASSWGAPKLRKAHPEWSFSGWLAEDLDAPWRDELELLPIEGAPRVGEWMFLHRASKTAITADVLFNLGPVGGFGGLLLRLAGTHGYAGRSRLFKALVKDRPAFEASLQRVLEWDFERLVVGHGEPITDDPKGKLRAAWGL